MWTTPFGSSVRSMWGSVWTRSSGAPYRAPLIRRPFPPEAYPPRYEDWIYPDELSDFTGVPLVTAGLLARGYGDEAIADIMGLNWLRVWEEVWGR